MKRILIFRLLTFCILIFIVSCQEDKLSDYYTISGQIEGLKDKTQLILRNNASRESIDTAYSDGSKFTFQGTTTYPKSVKIYFPGDNNRMEEVNFMLENTEISINGKLPNLYLNTDIIGGPEQELNRQSETLIHEEYEKYRILRDSFYSVKERTGKYDSPLGLKFTEHANNFQSMARKLALDNLDSYWGVNLISSQKTKFPNDSLKKIFNSIDDKYLDTESGHILQEHIYTDQIQIGDDFSDFTVTNINEETFSLSELKGKPIYLNFWGKGCRPCRQENQYISTNFSEINNEFHVVSFSLDKDKDVWKKTSEADGIIWNNVSDLKGHKSPVKIKYGVQALPASFLIDEHGIVIKKYVGFNNENLEFISTIKQHINKNRNKL